MNTWAAPVPLLVMKMMTEWVLGRTFVTSGAQHLVSAYRPNNHNRQNYTEHCRPEIEPQRYDYAEEQYDLAELQLPHQLRVAPE